MKRLSPHQLLSPLSLIVFAALIAGAYAILHAAGWREHVSILSGTLSEAGGSFATQAWQAGLYMVAYFSCVILVPILLLAAAIQMLAIRLRLRR